MRPCDVDQDPIGVLISWSSLPLGCRDLGARCLPRPVSGTADRDHGAVVGNFELPLFHHFPCQVKEQEAEQHLSQLISNYGYSMAPATFGL